jgi:AbiV family abortive infection protein
MTLSEQTLKAAALACFENAQSLYTEAKILADHECGARAVALAIIGLEEFAKAVAYTVAALSHTHDDVLIGKLRYLTFHEVKHIIADWAEGVQIETKQWAEGIHWQTGLWPSSVECLATMFAQLAKQGLAKLIEQPKEAKVYYKKFQSELNTNWSAFPDIDAEFLLDPDKKNAALYVDLTTDGQLKTPDRVADDAASQILGLEWFLEQYATLPVVLKDDTVWRQFAGMVYP